MFEVPMPENVKKYKGTLFFGLDARKLFTLILLIAYALPANIYLTPVLGEDVVIITIILLGAVLIPVGWKQIYGMNFERYLFYIWKYKISRPQKRHIEYRNLLEEALEEEYKKMEKEYRSIGNGKNKKGKKIF